MTADIICDLISFGSSNNNVYGCFVFLFAYFCGLMMREQESVCNLQVVTCMTNIEQDRICALRCSETVNLSVCWLVYLHCKKTKQLR